MKTNATFSLCANFGHNFYRPTQGGRMSDVVKCKNCSMEVPLNHDGDFEEADDKLIIHNVMKKLFLLRNYTFRRPRRRAFSI
ncbi:MAG: hypothetical protein HKO90_04250 [Flavobacteriaceae bacterium]|nr:hypothetical protein [Flavobacteriaceae bacterium]